MTIDDEFVKFCKALRCPLCGGQLDGKVHPIKSNLYCVNTPNEYKVYWSVGFKYPDYEIITYYYSDFEYKLHYRLFFHDTTLTRYSAELNEYLKNKTGKELLRIPGPRYIIFKLGLTEKEFLNKVRTYSVLS